MFIKIRDGFGIHLINLKLVRKIWKEDDLKKNYLKFKIGYKFSKLDWTIEEFANQQERNAKFAELEKLLIKTK